MHIPRIPLFANCPIMGRFVEIKINQVKIEQVIAHHLLNKKIVTLQGIGIFRLDPSVAVPADMEKDVVIPPNAVSFEYNPKATEDASLIDSIVQHTTKIKPLAASDLDSFLMLGRQFLNIGKPFTLDKLGTLDKAQTGELVFIPGSFVTPKIEAPKALKEDEDEVSSGLFNDYNKKPDDGSKKLLAIFVSIVVLGLTGWAIYHFMFSKKSVTEESVPILQQPVAVADSTLLKKDTAVNTFKTDTTHQSTSVNDSSFNIIIRQTDNKKEAIRYFNKLTRWGHHLVIYTSDSLNFKLAEVINLPLSDTTRVKDSLSKFYHYPVYVELK